MIFMEVLDGEAVAKDHTGTEMGGGGGIGDEDDAAKAETAFHFVRVATVTMAQNRILEENPIMDCSFII